MFDTTRLNYGMPSNLVNVWRSWDKAGTANKSKKGRGAFTVGAKIGIDDGNRIWILDIIRVRYGSYDREKLICDTAEMDGNNVKVCVEQEPGSGGKESAEGTVSRLIGYHIVIDRPVGDKETRADPFSVQVNAGNVWLIPGEWNKDFVDEMKFFPFSTTKDQIDACSAGFSKLSVKKIRVGGMRSRYDSNVKINPHEINSKKKTEDAIMNKIKKRIRSMSNRNA
jgi:predicted phage terminase large subunit-like protein